MLKSFAQAWLSLQCQMIPNVIGGMTALDIDVDDTVNPTACWPESYSASSDVLAAASLAVSRQAPVVSNKVSGNNEPGMDNLVIACPLLKNGSFYGVVSVQLSAPQGQQVAIIQLLQWGAAWLELLLAREHGDASQLSPLLFSVLLSALKCGQSEAAATSAANELMNQLSCERVSIGLQYKQRVKMLALSQSASYEPRSNLVRNIECAMHEAVVLQKTIIYPPADTAVDLLDEHAVLSKTEADETICTVLLINNDEITGAVSFERSSKEPFNAADVKQYEEIAKLLGPVIEMKKCLERSFMIMFREDVVSAPLKRIMRPHGLKRKIAMLSVLAFLGLLSFVSGDFRITAPANLEGKVQRVVVAPFDGYIDKAHVRAGETIKADDVLAELDDRDLRLERRKLISQREEAAKQYNKALAGLDHAQARIYHTQVSQAEAKLALLDEQLARTKILAPFDGVVISGDLSQSLGTPVERGELLFEMAPLNDYRVALQVDERDIANVTVGQEGSLTLAAIPRKHFSLIVEKVSSVYRENEANAVFRVEARIVDKTETLSLRPGMKGIGKISVGQRSYLWQWTRRMLGWLQLHLWAWLP